MIEMNLPTRKSIRLTNFDYHSPGVYFITVCTNKREQLFWLDPMNPPQKWERPLLSPYGCIVETVIQNIPTVYQCVSVDHFVIMPNHVHLLLQIHSAESGRPMAVPTVSTVINQLKGTASKLAGRPLWQSRFYDHIIRSDSDYQAAWNYVDGNPSKWFEDDLYIPSFD